MNGVDKINPVFDQWCVFKILYLRNIRNLLKKKHYKSIKTKNGAQAMSVMTTIFLIGDHPSSAFNPCIKLFVGTLSMLFMKWLILT